MRNAIASCAEAVMKQAPVDSREQCEIGDRNNQYPGDGHHEERRPNQCGAQIGQAEVCPSSCITPLGHLRSCSRGRRVAEGKNVVVG